MFSRKIQAALEHTFWSRVDCRMSLTQFWLILDRHVKERLCIRLLNVSSKRDLRCQGKSRSLRLWILTHRHVEVGSTATQGVGHTLTTHHAAQVVAVERHGRVWQGLVREATPALSRVQIPQVRGGHSLHKLEGGVALVSVEHLVTDAEGVRELPGIVHKVLNKSLIQVF